MGRYEIKGIMIDSSRLTEKHKYYFDLVDFIADIGYNTMLMHFTDDHGCAAEIPGFPELASKNAFDAKEIARLVRHAEKKNIDIIPELETFGHIRYLTDRKNYSHLSAFKCSDKNEIRFNAIDPLNPKSLEVMTRLVKAVGRIFKSKYVHIGCDEVDLGEYCKENNLDKDEVWAGYVNKIIGIVRKEGKIPILWGDHPAHSGKIAQLLEKNVVLDFWNYESDITDAQVIKLKSAGFKKIIVSPSMACWAYRFFPSKTGFENTERMLDIAKKHKLDGFISTFWCPYRYFQRSLYYGIAYTKWYSENGGKDPEIFMGNFSEKFFGRALSPELRSFLELWPRMEVSDHMSQMLVNEKIKPTKEELDHFQKIRDDAEKVLKDVEMFSPRRNKKIFDAFILSAKAAWLCHEYLLVKNRGGDAERKSSFNSLLRKIRKVASAEWDATRFKEDIHKHRPHFMKMDHHYALIMLKKMMPL